DGLNVESTYAQEATGRYAAPDAFVLCSGILRNAWVCDTDTDAGPGVEERTFCCATGDLLYRSHHVALALKLLSIRQAHRRFAPQS
ncbi:hypothetical protein ACYT69_11050, partial [Streptococcus pyogenes]